MNANRSIFKYLRSNILIKSANITKSII
jgi:hypothetical protein